MLIKPTDDGKHLDINFEVEKTTKREPNKALIRIYNLSERRRQSLSSDADIVLTAGYRGLISTIFSGDAREIYTSRIGPDIVTTIEAEDGGRSYRQAQISASFESGVRAADIMAACVDAMDIGRGNLSEISQYIREDGGIDTYSEGYTATGPAWRVLDGIVRSAGLTWSVQSGVLQLKRNNRPVQTRSIRLSEGTGLIGSPTKEVGQRRRRASQSAKYNAVAMLIPGLDPGRIVVIESRLVNGGFVIKKAKYTGSTFGEEWHAELNLEEY